MEHKRPFAVAVQHGFGDGRVEVACRQRGSVSERTTEATETGRKGKRTRETARAIDTDAEIDR